MPDISWSELLIIAVVTLLCVGPKELPGFLRTLGRYAGYLRRQANEFRQHLDDVIREAELEDMRREVDDLQIRINDEVMSGKRAVADAANPEGKPSAREPTPLTSAGRSPAPPAEPETSPPMPAPPGAGY